MELKPIIIEDLKLHPVSLPLIEPLQTSFGVEAEKVAVIVEVITSDGVTGWGESPVEIWPGYGAETVGTALHILPDFIFPKLLHKTIHKPTEVQDLLKAIRGNPHTKAGVETAIWDAIAKMNKCGFADLLSVHLPGGHSPRPWAQVGVSIGIQDSLNDTFRIIQKRLDQGYERIKLKIKPGWDVSFVRDVRENFPDIMLMVDANSAYTLADSDHLKQMDEFRLMMIEQPLAYDDIYEHSLLQSHLSTPLCLDESIKNLSDLNLALEMSACEIINLKPARVGGPTMSLEIYKVCVERDVPLWIGGMLETGIGRAANVAFASLPGVSLPSDISATDRYFAEDITEPPFTLSEGARLAVPSGVGIGVEVLQDRLDKATISNAHLGVVHSPVHWIAQWCTRLYL